MIDALLNGAGYGIMIVGIGLFLYVMFSKNI